MIPASYVITDTSPASATTAAGSQVISGLGRFDQIRVVGTLAGATGGTLDVYLQCRLTPNVWIDWVHFATVSAAAAAAKFHFLASWSAITADIVQIVTVGGGTDASPGVALAAAKFVGGHPGDEIRAVYVAGASTSAGAAVRVDVSGWESQR